MRLIGIAGHSGTGKTSGWRNMPPKETAMLLPNNKTQLPFPGAKKNYTKYDKEAGTGNLIVTNNLRSIPKVLKDINDNRPDIKYVLIDDFTHFFNAETRSDAFRKRKGGGEAFARWDDFAALVYKTVFEQAGTFRDDLTTVVHFHVQENDSFDGMRICIKTPGKLLDNQIDLPSYFTYMLYTKVLPPSKDVKQEDRYKYVTNDDGTREAKTPYGCFKDIEIPNDMKVVIDTIEKYENGE